LQIRTSLQDLLRFFLSDKTLFVRAYVDSNRYFFKRVLVNQFGFDRRREELASPSTTSPPCVLSLVFMGRYDVSLITTASMRLSRKSSRCRVTTPTNFLN